MIVFIWKKLSFELQYLVITKLIDLWEICTVRTEERKKKQTNACGSLKLKIFMIFSKFYASLLKKGSHET